MPEKRCKPADNWNIVNGFTDKNSPMPASMGIDAAKDAG